MRFPYLRFRRCSIFQTRVFGQIYNRIPALQARFQVGQPSDASVADVVFDPKIGGGGVVFLVVLLTHAHMKQKRDRQKKCYILSCELEGTSAKFHNSLFFKLRKK